jgi:hypothetical protein
MRTSFLLAASIASIFTLASIDRSAVAQMQPGPMSSTAKPKAAKASPRRTAAKPKRKAAARGFLPGKAGGKGPGRCGTMMYWKGGKCVDARTGKK